MTDKQTDRQQNNKSWLSNLLRKTQTLAEARASILAQRVSRSIEAAKQQTKQHKSTVAERLHYARGIMQESYITSVRKMRALSTGLSKICEADCYQIAMQIAALEEQHNMLEDVGRFGNAAHAYSAGKLLQLKPLVDKGMQDGADRAADILTKIVKNSNRSAIERSERVYEFASYYSRRFKTKTHGNMLRLCLELGELNNTLERAAHGSKKEYRKAATKVIAMSPLCEQGDDGSQPFVYKAAFELGATQTSIRVARALGRSIKTSKILEAVQEFNPHNIKQQSFNVKHIVDALKISMPVSEVRQAQQQTTAPHQSPQQQQAVRSTDRTQVLQLQPRKPEEEHKRRVYEFKIDRTFRSAAVKREWKIAITSYCKVYQWADQIFEDNVRINFPHFVSNKVTANDGIRVFGLLLNEWADQVRLARPNDTEMQMLRTAIDTVGRKKETEEQKQGQIITPNIKSSLPRFMQRKRSFLGFESWYEDPNDAYFDSESYIFANKVFMQCVRFYLSRLEGYDQKQHAKMASNEEYALKIYAGKLKSVDINDVAVPPPLPRISASSIYIPLSFSEKHLYP